MDVQITSRGFQKPRRSSASSTPHKRAVQFFRIGALAEMQSEATVGGQPSGPSNARAYIWHKAKTVRIRNKRIVQTDTA